MLLGGAVLAVASSPQQYIAQFLYQPSCLACFPCWKEKQHRQSPKHHIKVLLVISHQLVVFWCWSMLVFRIVFWGGFGLQSIFMSRDKQVSYGKHSHAYITQMQSCQASRFKCVTVTQFDPFSHHTPHLTFLTLIFSHSILYILMIINFGPRGLLQFK